METVQDFTLSEKYKSFLAPIAALQRENERVRMVTGSDFSMFGTGLVHLRETMASRILAFLLDPGAQHGQGAFFLRSVVRLLPIPELGKIQAGSLRHIKCEQVTWGADRQRRVDIVVAGNLCGTL